MPQAAAELTFRWKKPERQTSGKFKNAKFVKYRKQVGDSLQSCDMCRERSVAKEHKNIGYCVNRPNRKRKRMNSDDDTVQSCFILNTYFWFDSFLPRFLMSVQHAGKRQFGLKAGDVAVNTSRKKQLTSTPPTQKTPKLCERLGVRPGGHTVPPGRGSSQGCHPTVQKRSGKKCWTRVKVK